MFKNININKLNSNYSFSSEEEDLSISISVNDFISPKLEPQHSFARKIYTQPLSRAAKAT